MPLVHIGMCVSCIGTDTFLSSATSHYASSTVLSFTDCFSLMLHLPGNILFPGSLWCIIQQDRSDHTIMACFLLKRIYSCLREMFSLHWCLMIARRSLKTFHSKIAWKYCAEVSVWLSRLPSRSCCKERMLLPFWCFSGGFFVVYFYCSISTRDYF